MKKMTLSFLMALMAVGVLPAAGSSAGDEQVIRVALTRDDREALSSGLTFRFDSETVAKYVQYYKVKFPDPLPPGARVAMCDAGPIFAILQETPGQPTVKFTLDADMDRDLTNDPAIELTLGKDALVKIKRSYGDPSTREVWLPYRICCEEHPKSSGNKEMFFTAHYSFNGDFQLGGRPYSVSLRDGQATGHFIKGELTNVYLRLGPKSDKPDRMQPYNIYELIPFEKDLYEVRAIAEDGSWLELARSALKMAELGRPAPDLAMADLAGQVFRLSDYRGRMLLLDFWPSWCAPCVGAFPEIKKTVQKYAQKPLAVVGINLDEKQQVDQAKKVIADKELAWRQVVEGKGFAHPVYQVYGRLPENKMAFPVYVLIDEAGTIRYATNYFDRMARYLDLLYSGTPAQRETLFIPLSRGKTIIKEFTIADDPEQMRTIVASGNVKLPADLPASTRLLRMANGTFLLAVAGLSPDKILLRCDSDRDGDLTNNPAKEIPVLTKPDPSMGDGTKFDLSVKYPSGAGVFGSVIFFSRPGKGLSDAPPDICFFGHLTTNAGSFFRGETEYILEATDLTGDWVFSQDDIQKPGGLTLKAKKGEQWETYQGVQHLPIGGAYYRVVSISDEGSLVELEKEK